MVNIGHASCTTKLGNNLSHKEMVHKHKNSSKVLQDEQTHRFTTQR
jgi:hypothetical protein